MVYARMSAKCNKNNCKGSKGFGESIRGEIDIPGFGEVEVLIREESGFPRQ